MEINKHQMQSLSGKCDEDKALNHLCADETEEVFRCVLLVIAAASVGLDSQMLANLSGCSKEFINDATKRMEAAGLWSKAHVDTEEWNCRRTGDMLFGLLDHAYVAAGLYTRHREASNKIVYRWADGTECGDVIWPSASA